MPCGHLLGKDWPFGSRLWCLTVSLSLSNWYPRSGVYLIVSIPYLCTLTYFNKFTSTIFGFYKHLENLEKMCLLSWPARENPRLACITRAH